MINVTHGVNQFYVAVKPMNAYDFFLSYLALFVVILFYIIGYAWKRKGWMKLSEIDVDAGRREIDYEVHEKLRAQYQALPVWRRFLWHLF